ncbi:MAG: preprotein translocase subunit YajC [Nannocystaceae bacterium]
MTALVPPPSFSQLIFLLAEGGSPASPLGGMLPIFAIAAVVYFLLLRPMSKQEKDRKKRLGDLKKGDQIVIGGGILGRISNIDDAIVVVEIADKVKVRVLKKDIVDLQANAVKVDDKAGDKAGDKASPKKKDKS